MSAHNKKETLKENNQPQHSRYLEAHPPKYLKPEQQSELINVPQDKYRDFPENGNRISAPRYSQPNLPNFPSEFDPHHPYPHYPPHQMMQSHRQSVPYLPEQQQQHQNPPHIANNPELLPYQFNEQPGYLPSQYDLHKHYPHAGPKYMPNEQLINTTPNTAEFPPQHHFETGSRPYLRPHTGQAPADYVPYNLQNLPPHNVSQYDYPPQHNHHPYHPYPYNEYPPIQQYPNERVQKEFERVKTDIENKVPQGPRHQKAIELSDKQESIYKKKHQVYDDYMVGEPRQGGHKTLRQEYMERNQRDHEYMQSARQDYHNHYYSKLDRENYEKRHSFQPYGYGIPNTYDYQYGQPHQNPPNFKDAPPKVPVYNDFHPYPISSNIHPLPHPDMRHEDFLQQPRGFGYTSQQLPGPTHNHFHHPPREYLPRFDEQFPVRRPLTPQKERKVNFSDDAIESASKRLSSSQVLPTPSRHFDQPSIPTHHQPHYPPHHHAPHPQYPPHHHIQQQQQRLEPREYINRVYYNDPREQQQQLPLQSFNGQQAKQPLYPEQTIKKSPKKQEKENNPTKQQQQPKKITKPLSDTNLQKTAKDQALKPALKQIKSPIQESVIVESYKPPQQQQQFYQPPPQNGQHHQQPLAPQVYNSHMMHHHPNQYPEHLNYTSKNFEPMEYQLHRNGMYRPYAQEQHARNDVQSEYDRIRKAQYQQAPAQYDRPATALPQGNPGPYQDQQPQYVQYVPKQQAKQQQQLQQQYPQQSPSSQQQQQKYSQDLIPSKYSQEQQPLKPVNVGAEHHNYAMSNNDITAPMKYF